jgi:hypothetical protein
MSSIRRLTRPFTVVLLGLLLAPIAVDCCEVTSGRADGLACCMKGDGSSALNADCCGVEQAPAQQPPAGVAVRTDTTPINTLLVFVGFSVGVAEQTFSIRKPDAISLPGVPLYLRLSSLRR